MTHPSKWALETAREVLASGPFQHVSPGRVQHIAFALDAARLKARLECAEIAKSQKDGANLERHKTADGEGKACWLWAFDTANAIERDIRALIEGPSHE